jgi:hypothetical protein
MLYKSIEEIVQAANSGEFVGTVWVDNDQVYAYIDGNDDSDEAFNFNEKHPADVLVDTLILLGLKARRL